MATKTKPKTFPIDFGKVSLGDKTARITGSVSRGNLSLEEADKLFCDRRLAVLIRLYRKGETDGQKRMLDDDAHKVEGSADVKGYRVTSDAFALGFTFSLADIDLMEFAHFSKGAGEVSVLGSSEIDVSKPDPGDEDEE